LKRRPVPKKKKNSRPEPDPKRKARDMFDKKTKKYGAVFAILEEEIEEIGEIGEEPEE
jgi:hypothetical protein